ncbi:MAG: YeiH family protein [Halobacteriaceae archaeon]
MATPLRARLPGLGVLVGVAVLAHLAGVALPGVSPLAVAIAAGALLGNVVGVPDWAAPGVSLHKLALETGIVLLGARLALDEVLVSGPVVAGLAVATVGVGLLSVETLSRTLLPLDRETGSVLAGGASVCGVSAAAAVAGGIEAAESKLAYVAGTILLFDAVTLVAFPAAGHALGLSQRAFGVWAGLSMFSTGPVAAAGVAYGSVAVRWATLTKLVRNACIGVVAVGYSLHYASGDDADRRLATVWSGFPKFLVGFLAVAAVANAGLLSVGGLSLLDRAGDWLFAVAFAGLGFDIRVAEMRSAGLRPVAVVFVHLLLVSALALAAVWTLL